MGGGGLRLGKHMGVGGERLIFSFPTEFGIFFCLPNWLLIGPVIGTL